MSIHRIQLLEKMARNALTLTKLRFLFTLVFSIIPHAAIRIPGAIIRAWLKQLPLAPAAWNGFAGSFIADTPPDQLQAILPSTFEAYSAWVAARGTPRTVDVLAADNATRLLWMGPRKASKVLLFFHGTVSINLYLYTPAYLITANLYKAVDT
jgi:hypothetical protein